MAKIVEPKVDIIGKGSDNIYKFTLSNTNISVANAIRRTILTNINLVVIDPDNINIIKNTTQFNNEIICQRLSCIPVHIKDLSKDINNLMVEINVTNDTNFIKEITTKDFKIKETTQNKYLTEENRDVIFPADKYTNDYILFSRLKPKISNEIPGETLHIEATFRVSSAEENGAYNVVSTCAYAYTPDKVKQNDALEKFQNELDEKNISEEEIAQQKMNWENHSSKRYYKENSYDFNIESIGIWKNREIVLMACDIILGKLLNIAKKIMDNDLKIEVSNVAIPNCYDVTLENETYTIGKLLEYILHYEFLLNKKILSYVGFLKPHPHDTHSIIRIAYKEDNYAIDHLQEVLKSTVGIAKKIIEKIKENFKQ